MSTVATKIYTLISVCKYISIKITLQCHHYYAEMLSAMC